MGAILFRHSFIKQSRKGQSCRVCALCGNGLLCGLPRTLRRVYSVATYDVWLFIFTEILKPFMKTIFTCLLLGFVAAGFGQQNTFKVRVFGANFTFDHINQVIQLDDGSFVGVGAYTDNSSETYFLQTDASGNVLASHILTGSRSCYASSITKTSDGGFAICGVYDSSIHVMKLKSLSAGVIDLQWQKVYSIDHGGINSSASVSKILQTSDGGYIMAGASTVLINNSGGPVQTIIKIDASGNIIFSKRYSGYGENSLSDLVETTDGNYAFLASKISSPFPHDSAQITKIRPDGSVIWSRHLYEDTLSFIPSALTATSNGGLALTGYVFDFNSLPFPQHSFITKYNNAGDLLWSKTIVTNGYSGSTGITITEDRDGGYLFGGELYTYADAQYQTPDSSYAYVVKTNADGALQWTKTFEPNRGGFSEFYELIKTLDGGYAACGGISIYNFETDDYKGGGFINKYNSNFETCDEIVRSEGSIAEAGKSATATVTVSDITLLTNVIYRFVENAGEIDNVCSSSVLPLQLLSFNASLQNKSVAVQWSTANEINTNYFNVERSKDAVSFSALQQVTAKGNSAGVQTYNITDLQPLQGTSYYRLKEVDNDGRITYSSIVPVTVLNNGVIVISPNPVRDAIKVVMQSASNSSVTLQVVDMKGRVLAMQKASVVTGRNEIAIPAGSLARGVYVLKVIENNAIQTIRFVKE